MSGIDDNDEEEEEEVEQDRRSNVGSGVYKVPISFGVILKASIRIMAEGNETELRGEERLFYYRVEFIR